MFSMDVGVFKARIRGTVTGTNHNPRAGELGVRFIDVENKSSCQLPLPPTYRIVGIVLACGAGPRVCLCV